jgi:hypothetical protein
MNGLRLLGGAGPVPKVGMWPGGYRESGGYCVPMQRDAPVVIIKRGQCLSGYA